MVRTLIPLGENVLVKFEVVKTTPGGLVLPEGQERDMATVVAMGEDVPDVEFSVGSEVVVKITNEMTLLEFEGHKYFIGPYRCLVAMVGGGE